MGRFVFKLPDIGEGTAEAELVALYVNVGDEVREDQHVADVMTDKATVEIPAPVAGRVISIVGTPGEKLSVGSDFLIIDVGGADGAESPPEPDEAAAPALAGAQPAPPAEARAQTAHPAPSEALRAARPAAGGRRHVFKLPDIGEGSAEAELVAWHVRVGDYVNEDQPVVDVMTEKATIEIPSPVSGKVVSLNGSPGQMIAVGSELMVIETAGDGADAAAEPSPPQVQPPEPPPAARAAEPAAAAAASARLAPAAPREAPDQAARPGARPAKAGAQKLALDTRTPGEKPLASPAVRRKAWELGIELQFVPGTGPGGRITHDDLAAYVASAGTVASGADVRPAQAPGLVEKHGIEEIKVIGLRRKIAERMQEAKRRIPHFSYIEEVDVTALEDLRTQLNARWGKARARLTLLPFLMKALVRALPEFPQINARFDDDNGVVRRYEAVHIGVATQTPTGLVVPVVKHAEALDLWASAAEVSRLANAAREGKATRDELSGSTISITSLGALGGVATTPVINYPEVGIIGVNKMIERPVIRDGQVVVRKMMNLSSSFDHRVVDGWDAAEFIQRIRGLLEQPTLLFVD